MRPQMWLILLGSLVAAVASGCSPAVGQAPRPAPVVRTHTEEPWEREVRANVARAAREERERQVAAAWRREIDAVRLYVVPQGDTSMMMVMTGALLGGARSSGGVPASPLAPSGLTANLISLPAIALTWTDNSDNESGFEIQRSSDGISWGSLTYVAANGTYYEDESGPGTFYYRVRANAPVPSDFSNIAGPVTQP